MLKTHCIFYYGHTVTLSNKYINFDEGNGELTAEIAIKSYSLDSFYKEIARAMNEVSVENEYTTEVDRTTRRIKIIGNNVPFTLLIDSGTQAELSCFELAGFTGADLSGLLEYEGNNGSGKEFEPQYKLQRYTPFKNSVRVANSSYSENTRGDVVEIVSYGDVNIMKCDIVFQTNQIPQRNIKENPTGEDDLLDFMTYAKTKGFIEFMPDIDNRDVFDRCILDKTPQDSKGLSFDLMEMEVKEFFATGAIEFRRL